jgi:hypothetical protein
MLDCGLYNIFSMPFLLNRVDLSTRRGTALERSVREASCTSVSLAKAQQKDLNEIYIYRERHMVVLVATDCYSINFICLESSISAS